ncbi:fec operon regulator FecR [compost metagenome]
MERLRADELLEKYKNNTQTEQEGLEFDSWCSKYDESTESFVKEDIFEEIKHDVKERLPVFNSSTQKKTDKKDEFTTLVLRRNRMPLATKILLVAASIAIIGTIYTLITVKEVPISKRYANDIKPGSNKATLTFQNGKTIELSAAKSGIVIDASKLAYNDGTLINNEQAQAFTVSTPLGGTYQVKLPDGSNVWLNAGSSLTYDPYLKGKEQYRNVKLSGEAYFEVAKDKKHPFIVTTDKQKIEVLGTHFNVSAYIDDLSNKTSLLEGSVKVAPLTTTGTETKGLILKPGQQSEINTKGISVQEVDATEAIAWKNGDFSFTGENLENIMQKISRWYDVEVTYSDKQLLNKPFSGVISKYEKVSQVLCLLEATGEVKFKINGKKITVMP